MEEGLELVCFRWSTEHGRCAECGRPAAFRVLGLADREQAKRCAVCAANAAVDGERVGRIGGRDHAHSDGEPEGDLLLHLDEDHDAPAHAMASLAFARGWHGEQVHH
jgi:hypothetical protein